MPSGGPLTKASIRNAASAAGVETALHDKVKKVTALERRAVESTGIFCRRGSPSCSQGLLLIGVAGCVSSQARTAAEVLYRRLDTLEAASVPHPYYKTEKELDAYKTLWREAKDAAAEIRKARQEPQEAIERRRRGLVAARVLLAAADLAAGLTGVPGAVPRSTSRRAAFAEASKSIPT